MVTVHRTRSARLTLGAAILGVLTIVAAPSHDTWGGQTFSTPPADAGRRVEARHGIVASANALASEAGLAMLRAGGNAVDAAVATAFALGVVEPQMSGLGGGGVATIWIQRDRQPFYLDFYSAQPTDAWRGHTNPATPAARTGGAAREEAPPERAPVGDLRGVAVPGEVAGLLAIHRRFGTLPLATVMEPAIRLAEDGFPVGQMLASFIASGEAKMKPFPRAHALYLPNGKVLGPGVVLKNPDLALSLRRVASHGRDGFYEGPIAASVVATLNAGGHPARLVDLRAYEPQWKRPLCTDYRGQTVLSAPPPASGQQVLHALELLEPYDLKALGLPTQSATAFDVLVSAMRAGQSMSRFNGDPNWVAVPARGISSAAFAASRRAMIGTGTAPQAVDAADASPFDHENPPGACGRYDPYGPAPVAGGVSPLPGGDPSAGGDSGETTHLSAVDRDGNAVALTQTNSSVWGSGGFVAGFFLNDSGFRFNDENIEAPSLSRWRIRTTTISPTIVLRGDRAHLVIGAPGGGRIPTEVLQVMVYILDYGLDPLDAVRIPRIYPSRANPSVQLAHGFSPEILRDVRAKGYEPTGESQGYARLYLVLGRGDAWVGVSDPLHDGQPRGY